MPKALHTIVLCVSLLLVAAGSYSAIAASGMARDTPATKISQEEIGHIKVDVVEVRQDYSQDQTGKKVYVKASFRLYEQGSTLLSRLEGGRLAITTKNGQPLATGKIEQKGVIHYCNPLPGNSWSAQAYRFEMVDNMPAIELTAGEVVVGSVTFDIAGQEIVVALPETEAVVFR